MKSHFDFKPDLLIETTSVCDRMCAGCYAPNVVSAEDGMRLYASNPNLFLRPTVMAKAIQNRLGSNKVACSALRGGEPSRHPELDQLLEIAACFSGVVYLETHGRWILQSSEQSLGILQSCSRHSVVVKISFDRMHGLPAEQLRAMTDRLASMDIRYVIAITEMKEELFLKTRSLCDWIPDGQIVFQKKSLDGSDLIVPDFGVMRVDGTFGKTVNSKLKEKATDSRGVVA